MIASSGHLGGYLTFRVYSSGWLARFVPFEPTRRVEKIEGVDVDAACDFANERLKQCPMVAPGNLDAQVLTESNVFRDSRKNSIDLLNDIVRRRRTRYQFGSLRRKKRAKGPDAWEFRYYETVGGSRDRKSMTIGTLDQYRNEAAARPAVAALLLKLNSEAPHAGAGSSLIPI